MSLINDALKRAQQQQQNNPPPAAPLEFRSPDHPVSPTVGHTTALLVGLGLTVILLVGLIATLIWYVGRSRSEPMAVAAKVADAPLRVAAVPEARSDVELPPWSGPALSTPQFEHPEEPNTNRIPVAAEVVAAVLPALKLQGIAFNPVAPTVIINGRTLSLGDRIQGFRLLAISPVAATLVSATATNVLSLSD